MSLPYLGEGVSSSQISVAEGMGRYWLFSGGFQGNCSFVLPPVISTVAVTVLFFIPLLFLEHCSYHNPWHLPFLFPILLSRPPHGEVGVGRGEWVSGSGLESVSGTLNWMVPFLNQNIRLHLRGEGWEAKKLLEWPGLEDKCKGKVVHQ